MTSFTPHPFSSCNISSVCIGKTKAEAIREYRESNGDFNSIDDIKKVDGIGDALFEKIKAYIKV